MQLFFHIVDNESGELNCGLVPNKVNDAWLINNGFTSASLRAFIFVVDNIDVLRRGERKENCNVIFSVF